MGNILPGNVSRSLGVLIGAVVVLACMFASIYLGQAKVGMRDVVQTFVSYDESSPNQIIIKTSRIPRAFIAAAIGASLAIAGALIQAVTRNPLADPSVLGINYGASFAVVFAVTFLSIETPGVLMWFSFLGAIIGAAAAYLLGAAGGDGLTSLKIILAGAAISALFSSFTQGMLVMNEQGLDSVLFWLTGSIAGRTTEQLNAVWPYMAACWLAALLIARHINVLAVGEGAAQGLGQRTVLVKIGAGAIIGILSGCSVAVAGPVGFIGMVIPYVARFFAGLDYRWIIPYSALLGAILLLLADIAARFIDNPGELPVGAVTAMIGLPFFIYVARRGLEQS